MSEAKQPHRACEATIRVGGDDWGSVLMQLQDIIQHGRRYGSLYNGMSAGGTGGYIMNTRVDETMTNERYYAELDAYLAAAETKAKGGGDGEAC